MLIHLLAAANPRDRKQVVGYLALDPSQRSGEVAAHLMALMDDHGSVAFADEFAEESLVPPASRSRGLRRRPGLAARRFIRELVTYMVERDR